MRQFLRFVVSVAAVCATWTGPARADDLGDAAAQIAQAYAPRRPLVVHVGAGEGRLTLAIAAKSDCVLHGLEPDPVTVAKAMEAALKAQVNGRLWFEQLRQGALPYVQNSVNVVVVDDFVRISPALDPAELLRILAPDGVAYVGQGAWTGKPADEAQIKAWLVKGGAKDAQTVQKGGTWVVHRKPRPDGMDEWSHKWHDSTRNSASQDRHVTGLSALQWIGSDPYTWQMRHGRVAGNRVVLMYSGPAGMSRWATYKEDAITYEVFDAYSGALQWKRKYTPALGLGFDPVVVGDLIVTPIGKELHALDAATGESKLVYADAGDVRGGVVCDGVVVIMQTQAVKGMDLKTGKLLWTYQSKVPYEEQRGKRGGGQVSGMDPYCIPAGDGLVFISEKQKGGQQRLFGLDLRTGEQKWTFSDPAIGEIYNRHWYYMGRLMVTAQTGLYGLPVKAGNNQAWRIPVTSFTVDKTSGEWLAAREGYDKSNKSFFGVNRLVWAREGTQAKMVFSTKDVAKRPTAAKTWVGYDVETGKECRRIGYDVDGGWQQRCFPDQATPSFILSSNNEIARLDSGEITNYRAFRGMCGEGPFYGNGLYYVPTHYCIFCYPMVRGTLAVSSVSPPPTLVKDEERLEKGPAYKQAATVAPPKPEEWPAFRQNSKRTSGSTAGIKWPVAPQPSWKASFSERIVGPVIADNRVFVAVVNQGRIVALDAATGKELWTYFAGPRIDLPPTVYGEQVLFGCHDGYVYALRASDGALAWRFCAAPERRKMMTCDRVESSWPVMGSVLVAEGVAYVLAGRITRSDGGMHMYALDAVNGAMQWHKVLPGTRDPALATGIPCWKEPEGQMMNNLLYVDGDELRLPDEHQVWQFSAKTGEFAPRNAPKPPPTTSPTDKPKEVPYLAWYSARFPHHGFDRPTIGWLMHGMDPIAELRHPFESGTPLCFPDGNSTGVVIKRIRKSNEGQFTVLTPCKPDELVKGWDEKTEWKVRLMAKDNPYADVYAEVAAGDTAYLACTTYDPPQQDGIVRAFSLKDGKELDNLKLPACPVYDGMASGYGKLFIALRDGTLHCFVGK